MIEADFFNLVVRDSDIKSKATIECYQAEDFCNDDGASREFR